jgi:hypothetical protein
MCVLHDEVSPTYTSAVFFMIVSLPADAADTICCSMDLFILAVSDYIYVTSMKLASIRYGKKNAPAAWKPA